MKQRHKPGAFVYVAGLLLLLMSLPLIIHHEWVASVLFLLSLAGAFLCAVIAIRVPGGESMMGCMTGGRFDCDRVVSSIVLPGNTSPADLGLVYFVGLVLYIPFLSLLGRSGAALPLFIFPFGMAGLTGLLSLLYQWRMVRGWCSICLFVTLVIALQLMTWVLAMHSVSGWEGVSDPGLVLTAVFCWVLSSAWLWIRPLLSASREVKETRRRMQRWKKSPKLFRTLLRQGRPVDTGIWENEIIVGDAGAELQIIAVLSLYCPGCKKAFAQLLQLAHASRGKVSVLCRFRPGTAGRQAALMEMFERYFSTQRPEEREQIIADSFDGGKATHGRVPEVSNVYKAWVRRSEKWCNAEGIVKTPSIYIQGRQLPEPFTLHDLSGLLARPEGISILSLS